MLLRASQALGEGWVARPHREEALEMEGRRKPLLFKLTLLCFKFMPAGNLLGGSCKA